ncbi:hypothetical protein [Psychrobacillus mangrovi]
MNEKMILVRDYGIKGIGALQLSIGFPQGVCLLTKFFTINKV